MKEISKKIHFNDIFTEWMEDVVTDIKKEAIRLVSGPLLNIASGRLVNSFHTNVSEFGHLGTVWNDAPYAYTWEEEGIDYTSLANNKKVIKIVKRGVLGNRSTMGVIYRTLNYKKTKNKPPVHFLWTATQNEMTGTRGQQRFSVLGYEVGYAVARRYVDMLKRKYPGNVVEVWESN